MTAAASASPAFDVFNGDADGICALHQWRLAWPAEHATLVTGVKRDIALLDTLAGVTHAQLAVFDISIDANAAALERLLADQAGVTWFDHHSARLAKPHPGLRLFWDDAPDVCTSLLVDRQLDGRYRQWAVAAAFGDNLAGPARALAHAMGWSASHIASLDELGTLLNYNAYGERVEDLHVAPETLYRALHPYTDPREFAVSSPLYRLLDEGYRDDCARMHALCAQWHWSHGEIYVLPNAPWARRVSGMFANRLAACQDGRSFAVLSENADGSYVVSVRSGQPIERAANDLCAGFAGGGRRLAAGINRLPASDIDHFAQRFCDYFGAEGVESGAALRD